MNKNIREVKGQEMAKQVDCLKRIDDYTYQIKSQSSNNIYEVNTTELGFVCSCPDHKFRGVKCKHIYCVDITLYLAFIIRNPILNFCSNLKNFLDTYFAS
jgi:uncharacterized protein YydD (DUF2326 family)